MRCGTACSCFFMISVSVVTLPHSFAVFIGRMPNFASVISATLTAENSAGEKVGRIIPCWQSLPSLHFVLHHIENLWGNDGFMTALHIILRHLALIEFLLFRQEINREFLLQQSIALPMMGSYFFFSLFLTRTASLFVSKPFAISAETTCRQIL